MGKRASFIATAAVRRHLRAATVGCSGAARATCVLVVAVAIAGGCRRADQARTDGAPDSGAAGFDTTVDAVLDMQVELPDGNTAPDFGAEVDAVLAPDDIDVEETTPVADVEPDGGGTVDVPVDTSPTICSTCKWAPLAPMALPRIEHAGAWGGGALYVWGGAVSLYAGQDENASPPYSDGVIDSLERWEPASGKWSQMPPSPLGPRRNSRTVWGGDRLYIYGGGPGGPDPLAGVAFEPASSSWKPLPTKNSPGPRTAEFGLAWTGAELLVWGGPGSKAAGPGASYDPSTDSWQPLPPAPVEEAKFFGCYGWTGDALMGWSTYYGGSGVVYRPQDKTWSTFGPAAQDPEAPTTVGSGQCVGIDGGLFAWGYDVYKLKPDYRGWIRWQDKPDWQELKLPQWFSSRVEPNVGWTGKHVLLWSGVTDTVPTTLLKDGALYDPQTGAWQKLPELGQPFVRGRALVASGGAEMFIVGGVDGFDIGTNVYFKDGGRLTVPQ